MLRSSCLYQGHGGRVEPDALAESATRRALVSAAGAHGVLGTVLVELEESGILHALPSAARRDLQEQLSRLRLRSSVWMAERDRLLDALGEAGIRPVVLKGAALCSTAYGEPAERQFGDIDLLMARDEIEAAARALSRLGYDARGGARGIEAYEAHHFHVRLEHPRGFVAELHWDLTRPDSAFRLDPGAFLSRAHLFGSGQSAMRVPTPEDHLLHMVVQLVQEGFRGIRRLVDVDRILRKASAFDWEYATGQAARGGLATGAWLALDLADRILATPVSDRARERLRPGAPTRAHLGGLRSPAALMAGDRRDPSPVEKRLLRLWLRDRAGERLEYLWRMASGRSDPLRWLWQGEPPDRDPDRDPLRGSVEVGRLAAAQLRLTGAALLRGLRDRDGTAGFTSAGPVADAAPARPPPLRASSGGE